MPIAFAEFHLLNPRLVNSSQFLNAGERIVEALLDLKAGLPENDAFGRELAQEAGDGLNAMANRLGIDYKGKFTSEKRAADKLRCGLVSSIRRGVRGMLTEPDGIVSEAKLAAAETVRKVFTTRTTGFTDQTTAEKSTALRLLFADCVAPEVQAALKTSGFLRHYGMLQEAHQAFVEVLRKEGKSETDPDSDGDTETVVAAGTAGEGETAGAPETAKAAVETLPTLRELKETVSGCLWLTFIILDRHATKGREPYGRLLALCRQISDEVNQAAKGRVTRSKKAEKKKLIAEAAKNEAEASETQATRAEVSGRSSGASEPEATASREGLPA